MATNNNNNGINATAAATAKVATTTPTATVTSGSNSSSHASSFLLFGGFSNKGTARYNEDRMVALVELPDAPSFAFFAVYDGHGGAKCSTYCQKRLHGYISRSKTLQSNQQETLKQAFIKTDAKFLDKFEDGGTTAVAVLITPDRKLLCANAGDSRCVLNLANRAVPLSEDHKPGLATEKKRIEAANHEVTTETVLVSGRRIKLDRIDGIIAVSRGIGDIDFKDLTNAGPELQAVSCVPDIIEQQLTNDHQFIILACDGLWDVISNEEAIEFVQSRLSQLVDPTNDQICKIAEDITNLAIQQKNSTDNVTAVIVVFKH
eukprot:TRINITY_DN986_c2_g1_i1.p1 TRINITY_DN986_c2_g1~~TRINITY_DN986_c2_g1_i1.p1  ORF type:complete len:334 (-),score=198.74 TRINITY_DN986_c2_g1_i1:165-1118(-)